MKVKDLMKKLESFNPDAYVHIQTNKHFEEDVRSVQQYENENADVVVISSSLFVAVLQDKEV